MRTKYPETLELRAGAKPKRLCACGCGEPVKHGNRRYASNECRNRAEGRGRYKTLRADLAGRK